MTIETRTDPFSALLPENWQKSVKSFENRIQKKADYFYQKHPLLHRVVFVSMHIFRAMAMTALCEWLPWSRFVNIAVCTIGTLAYRFTVEPPCTMRFALGALEGQLSFLSAMWGIAQIVQGTAFHSLTKIALTVFSFLPATSWFAGVVVLSGKLEPSEENCCCQT